MINLETIQKKWWVKSKCWNKVGFSENQIEDIVFRKIHIQSYCYLSVKNMPFEFTKLESEIFKLERYYMSVKGLEFDEALLQIQSFLKIPKDEVKRVLSTCSFKIICRENENMPPIPLNLI